MGELEHRGIEITQAKPSETEWVQSGTPSQSLECKKMTCHSILFEVVLKSFATDCGLSVSQVWGAWWFSSCIPFLVSLSRIWRKTSRLHAGKTEKAKLVKFLPGNAKLSCTAWYAYLCMYIYIYTYFNIYYSYLCWFLGLLIYWFIYVLIFLVSQLSICCFLYLFNYLFIYLFIHLFICLFLYIIFSLLKSLLWVLVVVVAVAEAVVAVVVVVVVAEVVVVVVVVVVAA